MSQGINFATLIGHVGQDPEVREVRGGAGKVASFSLATSESWRDQASGERKERTEWHRIVIFREPLVEVVRQYVRKGAKLYIRGAIRTRRWSDKAGVERFTTEIVLSGFADDIQLLDRRDGRPAPAGDLDDYGTTQSRPQGEAPADAPVAAGFDADVPF